MQAGAGISAASPDAGIDYATDTVGTGPEMSAYDAHFYNPDHPDEAPAGSNDWACIPTAAHPRPVVLVHGTSTNAFGDFAGMSPALQRAGFCVFTFNYGRTGDRVKFGQGDIPQSAEQLAAFVDRVVRVTGSGQVDLIGHSLGGTMSRYYLQFDGGAAEVAHLITLGATNHGTTLDGLWMLAQAMNNFGVDATDPATAMISRAGVQQTVGSRFIADLNRNGDTVPGVAYTVVATRYDEVSTPYPATFLQAGPDATVDNITLQDGCEQDLSDHINMTYSPRAISIAEHALDPSIPIVCAPHAPWLADTDPDH
ncbi:esterase/lipase family protein [Nocardia stercoris]|nr:alpha/beta fold hydrolase [Nocardia stercoris]